MISHYVVMLAVAIGVAQGGIIAMLVSSHFALTGIAKAGALFVWTWRSW